jgi:hypothetical protein
MSVVPWRNRLSRRKDAFEAAEVRDLRACGRETLARNERLPGPPAPRG